jgi:hypothetical protein
VALPKVKIRLIRKPKTILPAPFKPRADTGNEPEGLSGTVQNMKASAPEERLARALDKQQTEYKFRYTVGAPRGMPGFKEVDFIVPAFSQYYAVEVDTAFTHREKGRADVLHDAIVLAALKKEGLQMFPTVIHVDGESDLLTSENALRWVKQRFPAVAAFEGVTVEDAPQATAQQQTQVPQPTGQAQPVQVAQAAAKPAPKGTSNQQQKIRERKRKEIRKGK